VRVVVVVVAMVVKVWLKWQNSFLISWKLSVPTRYHQKAKIKQNKTNRNFVHQ
jgi:hypothetical protein